MLGAGFLRLVKMARLLLAQDAFLPPDFYLTAPRSIRLLRRLFIVGAPRFDAATRGQKLSERIAALGPSYIKLGQFLATRSDIIGGALAADLAHLQDRLPPFSDAQVKAALRNALETPEEYLAQLSAPIAAASIAQVHQAHAPHNAHIKYAVKILRPNIERELASELRVFMRVARLCEYLLPMSRRLRPIAIVATLQRSVAMEVDLRMEAAALSEMAANTAQDEGFRVPQVIWHASRRRVLVMEWVDGIPIGDHAALRARAHDLQDLGVRLIRIFLTLALRDGFFHADMHQGNLLIGEDGTLIGIDLGITGRLDKDTRRFLAEILHGFITRDYRRVAEVHFEAGYVPHHHQVADFAQALRAIGEPIREQNADNISMSHLLAQLFAVTAQFDMATQPQLLLLQKTMVNVEGVARSLDPQINFWDAAEPVVEKWLKYQLGPEAVLRNLSDNASDIMHRLQRLPQSLDKFERSADALHSLAEAQQAHLHQPNRLNAAGAAFALIAIIGLILAITAIGLWLLFA